MTLKSVRSDSHHITLSFYAPVICIRDTAGLRYNAKLSGSSTDCRDKLKLNPRLFPGLSPAILKDLGGRTWLQMTSAFGDQSSIL